MMALQDLLDTTIEPPELYEDASGQGRFRSRRKRVLTSKSNSLSLNGKDAASPTRASIPSKSEPNIFCAVEIISSDASSP